MGLISTLEKFVCLLYLFLRLWTYVCAFIYLCTVWMLSCMSECEYVFYAWTRVKNCFWLGYLHLTLCLAYNYSCSVFQCVGYVQTVKCVSWPCKQWNIYRWRWKKSWKKANMIGNAEIWKKAYEMNMAIGKGEENGIGWEGQEEISRTTHTTKLIPFTIFLSRRRNMVATISFTALQQMGGTQWGR